MRFVVATLPDVKFPLGRDVMLAKSSALCGDETVVFSPTYIGTEPFLDFSDRPVVHQLVWLSILTRDPGFVEGEKLTRAQREERIKTAADASQALVDKGLRWIELTQSMPNLVDELAEERSVIASEAKAMAQVVHKVFSDNDKAVQRARELKKGEELGLIRLQQISEKPSLCFSEKKLVSDVTEALSASDAYGALDERFITPFRKSSQGQIQKQKVAQIAEEMFRRVSDHIRYSYRRVRMNVICVLKVGFNNGDNFFYQSPRFVRVIRRKK